MHLDSGEPSFEELPLITQTSWWGVHTHTEFFWSHYFAFSSFEVNTHPKWVNIKLFCSPTHLGIINWGQSMWAQIQLARLILKHFNVKRQSNFSIGKSPIWWKKVIVSHAKGTLLLDYFLKINDYRERKKYNYSSWHWTAHFSKITFIMDSLIILLIFDLKHI